MPHHTPISGVCLITFWISNLLRRVFPYQRAGSQADFGSLQALALQLARVYAQRPSCFVSFSIMFFSGKHKSEFVIVQIEVILDSSNNNLEPDSWSNWNLKMLVFEERGKPEYPEKNLSEQRREPTTNSTHIWRRCRDLNPGHIGGRRALSLLCHPLLWKLFLFFSFPDRKTAKTTFINPFATGNFSQNRVLKLFVAIKSENLPQNRLQVGVVHFAAFWSRCNIQWMCCGSILSLV